MTLPGPSRTIEVEPIEIPGEKQAPPREPEEAPAEEPEKQPEREPAKAPG